MQWKVLFYFGAVFSYVMAFYSKEIAITLPALIVLYDYYFLSAFRLKSARQESALLCHSCFTTHILRGFDYHPARRFRRPSGG